MENTDNELLTLEIIHRYVELLDKYFGSVCELDIIFNFEKVNQGELQSSAILSLIQNMIYEFESVSHSGVFHVGRASPWR